MNVIHAVPAPAADTFESPGDLERTLLNVLPFKVSAGFPSPAADHYEPPISIDDLLNLRAPHIWIVEAEGDSMSPSGIMNRSKLVLDRSKSPKNGDIIVAILDNQPVVKRLVRSDGIWSLCSDNPAYPPIAIDGFDSIAVFGVVTWSLTSHC